MAGTVKLPGLGDVKKPYIAVGAAFVVGIVGFAYYRRSRSSSSTAAAADTSAAAAIDPTTGYPTGSPEDLSALAAAQSSGAYGGYASSIGDTGTGQAGDLYYDPQDGLYDLTSPYNAQAAGTTNTGPGTFTDNAYWTQYAIENVQGYSASQIQGAIAAVFSGQALTATQMTIWQNAIAVAGNPPSAPTTPPHLANNGGGSTGGNTSLHAPGGIKVKSKTKDGFTVDWNKVTGATGYVAEVTHQGTTVAHGAATGTQVSLAGLHPSTSYGIRVAATDSAGQGPWSGVHYDSTSK